MTANNQIAEASRVGWADARKPIVKAAWAALSLSPSYELIYLSNWCEGFAPIHGLG